MFDFSTSEASLQMLQDARRADPKGGPGVSELPLDEQDLDELRASLAYAYAVGRTAETEYSKDVALLAKAEFDKVWTILIELDDDFRQRTIKGKTSIPVGSKKPYISYAKGEASEL